VIYGPYPDPEHAEMLMEPLLGVQQEEPELH